MGLLDSLEGFAAQQMAQSSNPEAKIAGGLMSALQEHPGGLQGVVDAFHENGMSAQVAGEPADPNQVGQVLGGSGLIENVAARAGVSPEVAQALMATVLPMVMSHFTQGGTAAPPAQEADGFAGMAQQLLGKFL
jgi:uncharacterized protein YidB (DUF937 family)